MDRYQAAERLARAIYAQGWGCLSPSEENALRDEELRAAVESLLGKLRRADLLTTAGEVTRPLPGEIFPEAARLLFSVDWERTDIARRAELWWHPESHNAVFEIKEWSLCDFHGALETGAHLVVVQKKLGSPNAIDLARQVRELLLQHGGDASMKDLEVHLREVGG